MSFNTFFVPAIGALLLSSCASTRKVERIDLVRDSLEKATSAGEFDAVIASASEGARAAATSKDANKQVAWTSIVMEANSRSSYLDVTTDESFERLRQNVFASADEIRAICKAGIVDPRQGRECALAMSYRALNDGVRAGRMFSAAAKNENWQDASDAATAFGSNAGAAAKTYRDDVSGLPEADQDATPFGNMLVRSACVFRSASGDARLPEETEDEARQGARIAYALAMAAAARSAEISPEGSDCNSAPAAMACTWAYENALANRCNELSMPPG